MRTSKCNTKLYAKIEQYFFINIIVSIPSHSKSMYVMDRAVRKNILEFKIFGSLSTQINCMQKHGMLAESQHCLNIPEL